MALGVGTAEWDAFRMSSLCESASDQGVRRLMESAEVRKYKRGDYLFFEGGSEMLAIAIKVISADVPCRVANYIVQRLDPRMRRLGKTRTIDLLVSRVELASALGPVSETLSRTFAQLVKDGLIEAEGHYVKILDLPSLMELAEFSNS